MSGRVPKERVGYDEFKEMADSLVDTLPSDYTGVVGIARGGLPLAVELSHSLQVPMGVVQTRSYEDDSTEPDALDWRGSILDHLDGPVLVVDDIVDTGTTMEAVDAHLHEHSIPFETAALHVKPSRHYHPDYFVKETPNWVVYPWEVEMIP